MAAHELSLMSAYCFLMGLSSCIGLLFVRSISQIACLLPAFVAVDVLYLRCTLQGMSYDVGIRSAFLGFVFSLGIMIADLGTMLFRPYGWYLCVLSMFHYSEFLTIALTNPRTLSVRSFVLHNGWEYQIAAICSWIEFLVEFYFFPDLKSWQSVSVLGLIICAGGEFLRKLAMWTAHTNFNHEVQSIKSEDHVLITHGVYRFMRHPSYVGWFYWSIGTQLILMNPICLIGYAIASWHFFHQRVYYEEVTLLNFFKEEYHNYQQETGTGLPFIKGYQLEE